MTQTYERPQRSGVPEPSPGKPGRRHFPWRHNLGDVLFAVSRGKQQLTVVGGELWLGMPHYHLEDAEGRRWRVPQLHVCSRPCNEVVR